MVSIISSCLLARRAPAHIIQADLQSKERASLRTKGIVQWSFSLSQGLAIVILSRDDCTSTLWLPPTGPPLSALLSSPSSPTRTHTTPSKQPASVSRRLTRATPMAQMSQYSPKEVVNYSPNFCADSVFLLPSLAIRTYSVHAFQTDCHSR